MSRPVLSRRTTLGGAAGVGIALPALAACGGDTASPGPAPTPAAAASSSAAPSSADPAPDPVPEPVPEPTTDPTTTTPVTGFASTADVPVGSGRIFPDQEVVVTQPTAGSFRCFSSICTHSGCPVTEVTTTIDCTCHGSRFSLTDGSPTAGPAADPLPEVTLTVEGDQLVLS